MSTSTIATATFDTNVFPAADLVQRAARAGIEAAVISVSRREVEGSTLEDELSSLTSIVEIGVLDESRWEQAVYASDDDAGRFEQALKLLSNGGFSVGAQRTSLTDGQRRQLRDAMILCTLVAAARDVLVSNDRRAFIDNGRREAIESASGTRVMTVAEFDSHLSLQTTDG